MFKVYINWNVLNVLKVLNDYRKRIKYILFSKECKSTHNNNYKHEFYFY